MDIFHEKLSYLLPEMLPPGVRKIQLGGSIKYKLYYIIDTITCRYNEFIYGNRIDKIINYIK